MAGAWAICRFAWRHFAPAPLTVRTLMTLRPLVCPLEVVTNIVPLGARVLDVGCGAGLFLHWLAATRRISSGVGIDLSAKAIDAAAACVMPEEQVCFVRVDAETAWPQGEFNLVSVIDVLHHIPRGYQRDFVRRVVAVGARTVLLKDIDPRPRWRAAANALHDLLMTGARAYPRPMTDVCAWLKEEGLRVVRAERVHRLWYSHYLIVAERS